MRLLHTSDWHLGRSLHRADLTAAQQSFTEHLVALVRAEAVDAVLLAGDVYDRAIPPLDAVALFDDTLHRLRDAGAQVVLISGNHDSAARLGVNHRLLAQAGVHLRTRLDDAAVPVLLEDGDGPVAVYALPYLEPDAVRSGLTAAAGRDVGRSHQDVVAAALELVAADRAHRPPGRSVLMAHGWVHGGASSDSERDITVGGVGAVPVSLLDDWEYVALGHLHRPQQLGEHVRYSGSALPYSFSEAGQRKGSWLVDLGPTGVRDVQFVQTPEYRRLSTISGTVDQLLTASDFARYTEDFLAVTLLDEVRPAEAMERLRRRFPFVLTLAWQAPEGSSYEGGYAALIQGRGDVQIATDFVRHTRGTAADPAERALLEDAFTAVRVGER
ncbi:MAG TPA: exonuclease SbcCD subunit D [Mycobacteriales bacterium]|nr:exonuclease SbcCD subunit D [Mycobacteriales bacterium]